MHTSSYSPEDNKLRLYPESRLSHDEYERVKAAGFRWAPKQELFVAPMWTPAREDLLLEMCGEIGDEDTSLVDRAEVRAERFEELSEKRSEDATRAHAAVSAIADNIPLGQPILVGHHSEKHARKDAERIENGMRKAVSMWEASKYWEYRAKGALRNAKYKERPDVRARRIKGLEADMRKQIRTREDAEKWLKAWTTEGLTPELARQIANYCWLTLPRKEGDKPDFSGNPTAYDALTNSYPNLYAPRTLDEIIETARDVYPRSIAGCQRWIAHFHNRIMYEKAMLEEGGGTVADKTGPEKGGACKCWASPRGGWSYIQKVNKVSVTVLDNWGNGGANFTRTIPFDKLAGIMTAAQVQEARDSGVLVESSDGTGFGLISEPPKLRQPEPESPKAADFDAMREQLKAGVQVVVADQLFPTPPDLAARMVEMADIQPGMTVLEPSAGTGNILKAIRTATGGSAVRTAIEISAQLCDRLRNSEEGAELLCRDFLACNGDLGTFDRIVMNPPFQNGDDIKHIKHAMGMLKPDGILVAICANGPRQRAELMPLCDTWEDLPAGTFAEQGTNVNTALIVIHG